MRKIIFATLVVFAFATQFAATAAAEETLLALWLRNNAEVVELLSIETKGSLLIEDDETIAGSAALLCTGIANGSVGPDGESEVIVILNSLNEEIDNFRELLGEIGKEFNLALLGTGTGSGLGSECRAEKGCAEGTASSPIEVWPMNLPWHGLLFLDSTTGRFLTLKESATKTIGFGLLCLVLGLNLEDECVTGGSLRLEVSNDPEDVAMAAGEETEPPFTCTQSNKASGHAVIDELASILPLEGLLSVSSE